MLQLVNLDPIEILVHMIFNQYLINSYCLTVVLEKSFEFSVNISFASIDPNEGPNLVEQMLELSENGCSDYIVLMKEPKKFMAAFDTVNSLGNVRRSDRKIVLLPYREDSSSGKDLLDILLLNETRFVANILLILPTSQKAMCSYYDLVTHKYIGQDNETHHPHYLDRWNGCTLEFDMGANLFPHDMTNLYGKTVKVACFTYKPYALLDLADSQVPLGRDGTEVRIVDEFCR